MEAVSVKRISHQTGSNIGIRKAKPDTQRRRSGRRTGNACVSLGGFRAIKLQSKLGIYVYGKLQVLDGEPDLNNVEHIYDELWPCFVRYHQLYHGCEPVSNYKDKSGIIDAFAMMLGFLSNMMGHHANIDIISDYRITPKGKESYYFCAYQQSFSTYEWKVIHVKPVIEVLKKTDRAALKVFIILLHALDQLGIETWYNGQMQWILHENFIEEIESGGNEPETVAELKKTMAYYTKGAPAKTHKLIKESHTGTDTDGKPCINLEELSKMAELIKTKPIRSIVTEALKVLKLKKNLYDYTYTPDEFEDQVGLTYDLQFTMAWDIEDMLTGYYEDMINCYANEGVFGPYQHLYIKPDCDKLFIPDQFTRLLAAFFDHMVDQLNLLTEPKKNKNARDTK